MKTLLKIISLIYSFFYIIPVLNAQGSPCSAVNTSCTTTVQSASNVWTSAGNGIVDPACTSPITTSGQYWISYVPTGSVFNVTMSDVTGGGSRPLNDVAFQLYYTAGGCGSTMTYVGCYDNDAGGGTDEDEVFTTVPGVTYYIRVFDADGEMDFSGGGQNHDFVYCVYEEGQTVCSAYEITSLPFSYTGTTVGALNTITGGCAGNEPGTSGTGEDYFFKINVAANSYLTLNLSGTTASNYTELSVNTTSNCVNGLSCYSVGAWEGGLQADNSPASSTAPCKTVYFPTAGTYYLQVDASLSASGPFTLDVDSYTPANGDGCTSSTGLSDGITTTTNNTNCSFTSGTDDPTGSLYCAGTIENTTWLHFQSDGSGTAVDVTVDNVTCQTGYYSSSGGGYYSASGQFGVLVSSDGTCSGTWSDAAAVSGTDGYTGCQSIATAGTFITTLDNSSVTDYYFLWDGNGGAECDFDITVTNVFPLDMELIFLDGKCYIDRMNIFWATASESNVDYFIVQTSNDGKSFVDLGRVEAAGESLSVNTYDFTIEKLQEGYNYYRLKEVDNDGNYSYSYNIFQPCDINSNSDEILVNENSYTIKLNGYNKPGEYSVKIYDLAGKMIKSETVFLNEGFNVINLDIISTGMLMMELQGNEGNSKVFKLPANKN